MASEFERDWNESSPDGQDSVTSGDDEIRNLKVEISDRLKNMLYGLIAGENTLAQHFQYLQLYEQASVAQPSAGFGRLYCKAVGDKAELFWHDEDGDEIQLTTGGKWNGAVLSALGIPAGSYAADSIDEDDIQLANNAALTAKNAAGTGTVNLIKAGTNNLPTLPDSSEMASSAAPVEDEAIANKKYVDDTYLTGQAVQVVNTQTGAVATGTTTIPYDDTIPQITEGTQFMTLAITPTSATNKLKIDVVFHGGPDNVNRHNIVALFQDATAGALAVGWQHYSQYGTNIKFTHYMVAGTTSETTFKIRAGQEIAGTYTFNGYSSSRKFGGKLSSSITITEIKV